jgi:hypothetical protein
MKLICKCGNIEELKTDKLIEDFEFKNYGDGATALVCKKYNEVVYPKLKNS